MFASPDLIGHMNKVKDSYNVNSMTQIAGEAALRDRKYWDWLVSSTIAERRWLLENVAICFSLLSNPSWSVISLLLLKFFELLVFKIPV